MSRRTLFTFAWALSAVCGLAGCETTESKETPPVAAQPVGPTPLAAPPVGLAAPPVGAGADIVEAPVVWPSADTIDPATLGRLPRRATESIATSTLPVLVPRAAPAHLEPPMVDALLSSAVVIAKPHWYSVALHRRADVPAPDAITVTLGAIRLARRHPHIEPTTLPRTLRGTPALVTQNEGIWSATWFENGISYTAEIECGDPGSAACADDRLITALVEDLVYVGGQGATR